MKKLLVSDGTWGAFDDKKNWNRYGEAVTKYPNVLYTHTADMIASRIKGV